MYQKVESSVSLHIFKYSQHCYRINGCDGKVLNIWALVTVRPLLKAT